MTVWKAGQMAIRTLFTELFQVAHPLVLAPMGGVSGGALAAAMMLGAQGAVLGTRFCATPRPRTRPHPQRTPATPGPPET